MATIFVSPGVYDREQDFTVFASRIGITRLGLAGKTLKGPAFQAIKVSSADEYALRFGGTHPDYPLGYVANAFLAQANDLTVSRVLGASGFINSPAWLITASADTSIYSGATLAILRSKKDELGINIFDVETDIVIASTPGVNVLSDFVLSAATGPLSAYTNGLTVSLDETKENYIVKVFGTNPEQVVGTIGLYVEEIYPHFVREAAARAEIGTISDALTFKDVTDDGYSDYNNGYTHSETPWIVSRVVGGVVNNLFKFHTRRKD